MQNEKQDYNETQKPSRIQWEKKKAKEKKNQKRKWGEY